SGPSAFPPAAGVILKQETSRGHEFGVEFTTAEGDGYEAVYFDQDVENAIYSDPATFSGCLQDVGTSTSKAIELFAEISMRPNLNFTANYTYNDTERANGLQRRRRPQHLANLGLSWFGLDERLNLNGFYRISRNSIDEVGSTV